MTRKTVLNHINRLSLRIFCAQIVPQDDGFHGF